MGDTSTMHYNRKERNKIALEQFWSMPVEFEDMLLLRDNSPFIVMESTPMSKLHFLFIMLNIA